jgi:hypothetical protein
MHLLKDLDTDDLKLACDSAETLIKFKAYLPPGGLMLMLVSKFRDDIREVLEMVIEGLPSRGRERRSLDELTSIELSTVWGAVMILLQARFTKYMDDPALPRMLGEFQEALGVQIAERKQLREETTPEAKAS